MEHLPFPNPRALGLTDSGERRPNGLDRPESEWRMNISDWANIIADRLIEEHRFCITRMAEAGRWNAGDTQQVIEETNKLLVKRLSH